MVNRVLRGAGRQAILSILISIYSVSGPNHNKRRDVMGMNILAFGPNGSGKGTQGAIVKEKYN